MNLERESTGPAEGEHPVIFRSVSRWAALCPSKHDDCTVLACPFEWAGNTNAGTKFALKKANATQPDVGDDRTRLSWSGLSFTLYS